ncbi:MAG: hypothetical protein A2X77_05445 [Gammaproteobacteria bacterium GWE2_42_36]|nr:MAG: hypothetical protein A2X77_05445 [Gammaproteobacteria bacterium GWE2_42_36]
MKKYTLGIIVGLFLLNGCGFHLVGTADLPPSLKTLYINSASPYSDLTKTVRQMLESSHVQVVRNPKEAPLTLDLISENFATTQTTIGGNDQMQNYVATYSVTYDLKNAQGQMVAGPFTSQKQENITILQNEVITNSNKLTDAQQALTQKVAEDILFHLSAKNTLTAIKSANSSKKTPQTTTPSSPPSGLAALSPAAAQPTLAPQTTAPLGFYGTPFIGHKDASSS